MVETDLLCEMTADCNVKLGGIRYILVQPAARSSDSKSRSTADDGNASDSDDFLVIKPGRKTNVPLIMRDRSETNVMASPEFKRRNQRPILPGFTSHAIGCACNQCSNFALYELVITYMMLQAECLHIEGLHNDSKMTFAKVEGLCEGFDKRVRASQSVSLLKHSTCKENLCSRSNAGRLLRFQNRLKLSSLLFDLGEYQKCLAEIHKMNSSVEKWDAFTKATNAPLQAALKYQHAIVSMELLGVEKGMPTWKLFDANWSTLLPCFADRKVSTNDEAIDFKTPVRNLSAKYGQAAKFPARVKKCRAPVKKMSLFIYEDKDEELNTAMINLSLSDESSDQSRANDVTPDEAPLISTPGSSSLSDDSGKANPAPRKEMAGRKTRLKVSVNENVPPKHVTRTLRSKKTSAANEVREDAIKPMTRRLRIENARGNGNDVFRDCINFSPDSSSFNLEQELGPPPSPDILNYAEEYAPVVASAVNVPFTRSVVHGREKMRSETPLRSSSKDNIRSPVILNRRSRRKLATNKIEIFTNEFGKNVNRLVKDRENDVHVLPKENSSVKG